MRSSWRPAAARLWATATAGLGFIVLLMLGTNTAAAARHNPCDATSPAAATGPHEAYLILQNEAKDLAGSPIFVDGTKFAELPERHHCVWLRLPAHPEAYRIEIRGQGASGRTEPKIGQGRTYYFNVELQTQPAISEGERPTAGIVFKGNLLPRLAVRFERTDSGSALPGPLVDLVAEAAPLSMELNDEQSSSEPSDARDIAALLQTARRSCDPSAWELDPLQYLLVLKNSGLPGQPPGFSARLYNTAIGDHEPAAVVESTQAPGSVCQELDPLKRMQCVIRAALDKIGKRRHACLRIEASSARGPRAGVQLRLRPLTPDSPASAFIPLGVTGNKGQFEQAFFAGRDDQTDFELEWELADYTMDVPKPERMVQLHGGGVDPYQAALRRTKIPLYKKWWLWQIIGTSIAVGVGAAVGASFANRGAAP